MPIGPVLARPTGNISQCRGRMRTCKPPRMANSTAPAISHISYKLDTLKWPSLPDWKTISFRDGDERL